MPRNDTRRPRRAWGFGAVLLLSLPAAVPVVLSGCGHPLAGAAAAAEPADPPRGARATGTGRFLLHTQRRGVLAMADHARLIRMQTAIEKTHRVPDADLDFWVSLLHKGPIKDAPYAWAGFHALVLGDMVGAKRLTPSQQRKLYDALLPCVEDAAYTKDFDPADPQMSARLRIGNKRIAIGLLAETRDPRAAAVLERIARTDPSDTLRREASGLHALRSETPPAK